MRWLRQFLDKQTPRFQEGKLRKLFPLFEAADTFLFTAGKVTDQPTHVRDGLDLKRMMGLVVLALTPCIFMACFNTGYQANLGYEQYKKAHTVTTPSEVILDSVVLTSDEEPPPVEPSTQDFTDSQTAVLSAEEVLGWRYVLVGEPDSNSFVSNFIHGTTYFLPIYLVCMVVGGICEAIFAIVRGHA